MEGHRCIAAEEEARPVRGEALGQGHHDNGGGMGDYRGNSVAPDCGFHGSAEVQAECRDRGWLAERSSGCCDMFGGSHFLPHGGSSVQTGHRLDRTKLMN